MDIFSVVFNFSPRLHEAPFFHDRFSEPISPQTVRKSSFQEFPYPLPEYETEINIGRVDGSGPAGAALRQARPIIQTRDIEIIDLKYQIKHCAV